MKKERDVVQESLGFCLREEEEVGSQGNKLNSEEERK